VPYITTILSNALWLYYGLLKQNEVLLTSISAIGICFGAFYVSTYLIFAIAAQRVQTPKP
jgi:solute carrier family 50 protein (sugar transporter)